MMSWSVANQILPTWKDWIIAILGTFLVVAFVIAAWDDLSE